MDSAVRRMLNQSEWDLLRETEPARLRKKSEDDLAELHARVRRARNKYSKLYRRRASAQVKRDAARGKASATHVRTARKAELFEEALGRVSAKLAKVAQASADQLRKDRLAAARAAKRGQGSKGKRKAPTRAASGKGRDAKKKQRTPARKRAAAASRATTKRKQAKKDARR
jgi:hypothetical protein